MATPVDPDKQASLNADTLATVRGLIAKAHDFVARVYIPDVLAVAAFYKDWAGYGAGVGNYLVYGEYPEDDVPNAPQFLPSGVIRGRDLTKVEKLAVLLGIAFFFLLNFPLLEIFNRDLLVGGIPLLIIYLFGIWVLAVILLFLCGRRIKSQAYPGSKQSD